MLKKLLLFILVTHNFLYGQGQIDSLSENDKALLDSMMANDEFLNLIKEDKAKNTFDVSVALSNGIFSATNNAANATSNLSQLIIIPTFNYNFKQGISVGISGFLSKDDINNISLYQTALTAGYDFSNKKVSSGLSYTRYLSDKNKYNSKSIYQNDFYGHLKRTKGLLQPAIYLGYANGTYKDVALRQISGTNIFFKDTTTNTTSYFSATASVAHDFSFYKIFNKKDGLDFTPSIFVNLSSDNLTQLHTNRIFERLKRLSIYKKSEEVNKFQLQSVAASLNFTYSIGKFFFQPNIYLDYYLPETVYQKLSTVVSVSTGFTF